MSNDQAAREAILQNIDGPHSGAKDPAADYAQIPREYIRSGALGLHEKLDLLEHRLREYDAEVYRTPRLDLRATIQSILASRNLRKIAIPEGLPASWLPETVDFVTGDALSPMELDTFDGVLTACTAAIALTGSLVLQNVPGQGPRKLSLVPDYHLCVVHESQVVETVAESFAMLKNSEELATTFISGPSATADIEMTRIKGVHGPRFLDVVLVAE